MALFYSFYQCCQCCQTGYMTLNYIPASNCYDNCWPMYWPKGLSVKEWVWFLTSWFARLLTQAFIMPHVIDLLYSLLMWRQRAIVLTVSWQCHHHVRNVDHTWFFFLFNILWCQKAIIYIITWCHNNKIIYN